MTTTEASGHNATYDLRTMRSVPPSVQCIATCSCLTWGDTFTAVQGQEATADLGRRLGDIAKDKAVKAHAEHVAAVAGTPPPDPAVASSVLDAAAVHLTREARDQAQATDAMRLYALAEVMSTLASEAKAGEVMLRSMGLSRYGIPPTYSPQVTSAVRYALLVLDRDE